MRTITQCILAAPAVIAAVSVLAAAPAAVATEGPAIGIGDVDLFYRIYDAAKGRPTAEQLQRDYLDQGSEGLRTLARLRNVTGERMAAAIAKSPQFYEEARGCASHLPRVRARLGAALKRLQRLYPEARLPPVTIAVGRGKPVGVGGPATGVQIGLEALCATRYLNPDVEDRFVFVIAHEYVHVQQDPVLSEREDLTVLEASLVEGAAEFVGELIAGRTAYPRPATAGREHEIETAFVADQDDRDLTRWVYNGTAEKPGDLGYWVGYRIARTFYRKAADKRAALRDILQMKDAKAFLAKSGWYPGVDLEAGTVAPP